MKMCTTPAPALDDGHLGLPHNGVDQVGAAARDQHVDKAPRPASAAWLHRGRTHRWSAPLRRAGPRRSAPAESVRRARGWCFLRPIRHAGSPRSRSSARGRRCRWSRWGGLRRWRRRRRMELRTCEICSPFGRVLPRTASPTGSTSPAICSTADARAESRIRLVAAGPATPPQTTFSRPLARSSSLAGIDPPSVLAHARCDGVQRLVLLAVVSVARVLDATRAASSFSVRVRARACQT